MEKIISKTQAAFCEIWHFCWGVQPNDNLKRLCLSAETDQKHEQGPYHSPLTKAFLKLLSAQKIRKLLSAKKMCPTNPGF